jgi:alkanesulfonate monooxygenase SsuD/methylene tetrahydromethanopterin reductase-like flavin-dependent oxidoreductase (luciferase family)
VATDTLTTPPNESPADGREGRAIALWEKLFADGCCDGIIVWPTVFPGMFEEFARLVVPDLQRRGIFRTEYQGRTLRENLQSP